MAQSVLSVRMDEKTKREFAGFCEEAGMSVSTAINLFARQTVAGPQNAVCRSLCARMKSERNVWSAKTRFEVRSTRLRAPSPQ